MSAIYLAGKPANPAVPAHHRGKHDMDKAHWPTEIKLTEQGKLLRVDFETGESFEFSSEFLRVVSPSAEVQGHSPGQKKTVAGKRDVAVLAVEPVGNYAVQIAFDDRHASGIYTWDYLHEIGARRDRLWTDYLDELKAKGLSR
jgi:DUF971 family protein